MIHQNQREYRGMVRPCRRLLALHSEETTDQLYFEFRPFSTEPWILQIQLYRTPREPAIGGKTCHRRAKLASGCGEA